MSEFYVGYLPIPPGLRRWMRRVVAGVGVLVAAVAILLVWKQSPFADAAFEFREYSELQGVLLSKPYPAVAVRDGAPWLLAASGKHGFVPPAGLDGMVVRLRGERIFRGPDRMLQVQSIAGIEPGEVPGETDLGGVELTGEIVDSKCYFGVMNPGSGKVHRDCAARCLSGGIPPALVVRGGSGAVTTVLIANWRRELLDKVAEPVTLRGRLARSASRLILYAE
jgi:hypothetical protein